MLWVFWTLALLGHRMPRCFTTRRYTGSPLYAVVAYICLSVCRSSVTSRYCIKTSWSDRAGFWHGFFQGGNLPLYAYKEIRVLPEMRVFPSGTLSQTLDFENVATKSRSCRQHNSSTVELVDHICDGLVYASWLFTEMQP